MKRIWDWLSERLFVTAAASGAPGFVRPAIKMDTPHAFSIADVDALRFA